MLEQTELAAAAQANPDIWYAGYDASNAGKGASTCPYTPSEALKMDVWLSGHVTATDEREKTEAAPSEEETA